MEINWKEVAKQYYDEYGHNQDYIFECVDDYVPIYYNDIALEAAKMVQQITGTPPTIHADVNSKDTALSYRMLNVIMGMVQGMGFPIKVKPDAWAADIADMFTR